ncbi:hypothetical protein C8Q74DRAFT_1255123 [Fomes fomentarius]|nr:hypothetical protein C8Q74DRAFT_1255123 [Fomes fomentarius]
MIPKYSNPSVLLESTTLVSRAALHDDSDDEGEVRSATDPEHAQMVARLENILKRSIADMLLQASDEDADRQSRKKKKRKVEKEMKLESAAGEEVVVPFRLFSGMTQPRPIVLAPKPQPIYASKGPALEDTEVEAELRAARAREIAVDFAWVMDESSKPTMKTARTGKTVERVIAKLSHPDARLLVLERPKPPPKPPCIAQSHPDIEVEPSPHEHGADCCPVVEAPPSSSDPAESTKRKRRRGKLRQKPVVQPTFWRPPPGLGGKSLGYAWGYSGSRPMQAGQSPHYRRDTMKRAVYA